LIIRILLSYVFNDAHFVKNLTTFDNDIITHYFWYFQCLFCYFLIALLY